MNGPHSSGPSTEAAFQPLVDALLVGDHKLAAAVAQHLIEQGCSREQVVTDGLEHAMGLLDDKCTVESFNLLEIMLVGRAVSAVVRVLYPDGYAPTEGRATFVIATLEGDVHDLGKNIVRMVLAGKGFRVVDLGRDCPVDDLVGAAQREGAAAVLVSGLISPVVSQVRKLRPALRACGLAHVPVVAGGAALKQLRPEALDVDYVAENAFDGAHNLERHVSGAPTT
jgi:5-methyltetrahydrofolate--homocysteine methyltransferase